MPKTSRRRSSQNLTRKCYTQCKTRAAIHRAFFDKRMGPPPAGYSPKAVAEVSRRLYSKKAKECQMTLCNPSCSNLPSRKRRQGFDTAYSKAEVELLRKRGALSGCQITEVGGTLFHTPQESIQIGKMWMEKRNKKNRAATAKRISG